MLRLTSTHRITTFFALAVLLAMPALAAPTAGGVADVLLGVTQIDWVPANTTQSLSLTISGPEGVIEKGFAPGETPSFDLAALSGNVDGSYYWQLKAAPELSGESRRLMAEARAKGTKVTPQDLPPRDQIVQSGHFRVVDGAIVQPSEQPEARLGLAAGGGETRSATGSARFITEEAGPDFSSDVEVRGSLCVGLDCNFAESFGFDTIRLKENNLRIHFNDTSNSGSFPTVDWRIVANDSANGGASYYGVENADTGQRKLHLASDAKNHAIRATSAGVGLHEDLPVLDLHITEGDTPAIRLEQDGSSGFQAQTWDIAGNESNFFVRDVNNGSNLAFRIKPGSGNGNGIVIAANGDVGMGTDTPDQPLHLVAANDVDFVLMLLEHNGAARIRLQNTTDNVTWNIGHANPGGQDLVFSDTGDGDTEMALDTAGNMTINGTLTVLGGGGGTVPDYVFEPGYELMPLAELRQFIAANGHLPRLPSQDDVYAQGAINMTEVQKLLWEKVEELTLYTLEQHDTIEALRTSNEKLNARLSELDGEDGE